MCRRRRAAATGWLPQRRQFLLFGAGFPVPLRLGPCPCVRRSASCPAAPAPPAVAHGGLVVAVTGLSAASPGLPGPVRPAWARLPSLVHCAAPAPACPRWLDRWSWSRPAPAGAWAAGLVVLVTAGTGRGMGGRAGSPGHGRHRQGTGGRIDGVRGPRPRLLAPFPARPAGSRPHARQHQDQGDRRRRPRLGPCARTAVSDQRKSYSSAASLTAGPAVSPVAGTPRRYRPFAAG
jgi:hypothetical protein